MTGDQLCNLPAPFTTLMVPNWPPLPEQLGRLIIQEEDIAELIELFGQSSPIGNFLGFHWLRGAQ